MAVRVEGLAALQRAFKAADEALVSDVKDALEEAAAPVRLEAQTLAGSEIRNLQGDDPWTRMRVGTKTHTVYVAPVERRRKQSRRRRNLFDLLLGQALEPALERNVTKVERRVEDALDDIANLWERTR